MNCGGEIVAAPVTVSIPHALRKRTGQQRHVQVEGKNVREVIDALERAYPGTGFQICHETGELRPFVSVVVGGESARYLVRLDTGVKPGEVVHIMHSVAGGM